LTKAIIVLGKVFIGKLKASIKLIYNGGKVFTVFKTAACISSPLKGAHLCWGLGAACKPTHH